MFFVVWCAVAQMVGSAKAAAKPAAKQAASPGTKPPAPVQRRAAVHDETEIHWVHSDLFKTKWDAMNTIFMLMLEGSILTSHRSISWSHRVSPWISPVKWLL